MGMDCVLANWILLLFGRTYTNDTDRSKHIQRKGVR